MASQEAKEEMADSEAMVSQQQPAITLFSDADYEKSYAQVKRELDSDRFNPIPHVQMLGEAINAIDDGARLSPRHRAHLLYDVVPAAVRILSYRRFKESDEQFLRVNEFFLRVIDLAIKFMPNDVEPLMESLNRIFDDNRPYYSFALAEKEDLLYARLQSEKAGAEDSIELQDYAVMRSTTRSSRFVVYNVNYFINRGGMDALLRRLGANPPVPILKLNVGIWYKMKSFLIPHLQHHWLSRVEYAFSVLMELPEEELRMVRKEDVEEIVRLMEGIIREYGGSRAYELCERFSLNFALKCFKSSNLERRMHGLSYIEDVILMTNRRRYDWDYSYAQVSANYARMYQVAKWMEPKFLLEWIQQSQIIETLFTAKSSDMHPELIKRAKPTLKYLADNHHLSTEQLDMVWKARQMTHVQAAVYEMLTHLCTHLSFDLQLYLLKLIQAVPFMEFCPALINLLAQYHSYSGYTHTELKLRTTNVLWQLIQDDSQVEQAIADAAMNQLLKLLISYDLRTHRYALLNIWLDRIMKGQSVYQCISLMHKMLDKVYSDENSFYRDTEFSRKKVLDEFKRNYNLVDELIKEIEQYKRVVHIRLQEAQARGDTLHDLNNTIYVGRYTHLQAIRVRLDFIQFVMENSSARLKTYRAEMLWEALYNQAISKEESELLLAWLHRVCRRFARQNDNPITSKMAAQLFNERLCHLNFADITPQAFECFKRYFCCLNSMNQVLKMESPRDDNFYVLAYNGLVGLEHLWEIVLTAKADVVFWDCRRLLVDLHHRIGGKQAKKADLNCIRRKFVDRCMAQLKSSMDALRLTQNTASHHVLQVDRVITLLQDFLQEPSPFTEAVQDNTPLIGPLPAYESAANRAKQPPTPVTDTDRQSVQFVASMMGLSELAAAIALNKNHWNLDMTTSWIMEDVHREEVLKEEEKWAPEEPKPEAQTTPTVEEEEIEPCRFISDNPRYFEQLFDLLNLPAINTELAWGILFKLPRNPEIQAALTHLEGPTEDVGPQWNMLFSPHTMYKTLYCLQIVDNLMAVPEPPDDTNGAKQLAWCRKFFHTGGFQHLLDILLKLDLTAFASSPAFKPCLHYLLKILHYFIAAGFAAQVQRGSLALSRETTNELICGINFPRFLHVMINLMWDLCLRSSTSKTTEYDVSIVRDAMGLVMGAVLSQPDLLPYLLKCQIDGASEGIEDFVVGMTMRHPDNTIRTVVTNAFLALCRDLGSRDIQGVGHLDTFFMDILLRNLPPEASTSMQCDQYFLFLANLIAQYFDKQADAFAVYKKFEDLLWELIGRIKRRQPIESSSSSDPDLVFIGLLSVVFTICAKYPAIKQELALRGNLINEIWDTCLFPVPQKLDPTKGDHRWRENAKCKTLLSRENCFRLLTELAKDCPANLVAIAEKVTMHHEKELMLPSADKPAGKNESGYVGLLNPGCICYMNSVMQQLFMNPVLRYGLLAAKPNTQVDAQDNAIVQIQQMFGHLHHSEKQFYDPTETFCKALKDRGGQPIDLHQQQDAEEFLRLLCERLEELLKGSESEKLLNNFTGIESQILRCPNDPRHFSEREDPISVISIEIKGKQNLQEALSFYVSGEQVEWKCEKCEKTVEAALKRISLKKLSNTLILHLKRFDFNYETMLRNKLSNLFQFPMEIDMEAYTTEGIARMEAVQAEEAKKKDTNPPHAGPAQSMNSEWIGENEPPSELPARLHPASYYQYQLVGVLVHSGNAEAGHYYSYIKDRTNTKGQWLLFDDKHVKMWTLSQREAEEEWFGGDQIGPSYNGWPGQKTPRLKNAYMLFYQRIQPEAEEFPLPELLLHNSEQTQTHSDDSLDSILSSVVPSKVLQEVWEENHVTVHQRRLFELPYLMFVRDLTALASLDSTLTQMSNTRGSIEDSLSFRFVQSATYFALDNLARCKEEQLFTSHSDNLSRIFAHHVPGARWFVHVLRDQHQKWLKHFLVDASELYVREGFARCLASAMRTVVDSEVALLAVEREARLPTASKYDPDLPITNIDEDPKPATKCEALELLEDLLSMMETLRASWRRFQQYWKLLRDFAMSNNEVKLYMIERGVIGALIDQYMGEFSPYFPKTEQRVKLGEKATATVDLGYFMDLLGTLVAATNTRAIKAAGGPRPPTCGSETLLANLPHRCLRILLRQDGLGSLVKQCYSFECNVTIIKHLSWNDKDVTYMMLAAVINNIKPNEAYNYVHQSILTLVNFLRLIDHIQLWRIHVAFSAQGGIFDLLQRYQRQPYLLSRLSLLLADYLVDQVDQLTASYLHKTRDVWHWVIDHLAHPASWQPFPMGYDIRIEEDLKLAHTKLKMYWENPQNYITDFELDPDLFATATPPLEPQPLAAAP